MIVEHPVPGLVGRPFRGRTPAAYGPLRALRDRGRIPQAEFMRIHAESGAARRKDGSLANAFIENFQRYIRWDSTLLTHDAEVRRLEDDRNGIVPKGYRKSTQEELRAWEERLRVEDLMSCIRQVCSVRCRKHRYQCFHRRDLLWVARNTSGREEYDREIRSAAWDAMNREASKIENFDGSFGFVDSPLAER